MEDIIPSTKHCDNINKIDKIIKNNQYAKLLKYDHFDDSLLKLINLVNLMIKSNYDVLKHVINNSINLENRDGRGSIIHVACEYRTKEVIEVIQLLIDNNVDLNCETSNGVRPIHVACRGQTKEVIQVLINNKVNLNCETKLKTQPIYIACHNQTKEVIQLLIDNKVDLNCNSTKGIQLYKIIWMPENHYLFDKKIRDIIEILLLILKKINTPIIMVPKYIRYDIIRMCVFYQICCVKSKN